MTDQKCVIIKIETAYEKYMPFGILYVADALRKASFSVECHHIHESELDTFLDQLIPSEILFVGFSVMTSTTLIPTIKASKNLVALKIPVVWGGIHATILPELCLDSGYVDYVIMGEGEETIVEFAQELHGSRHFETVKGLAYVEKGSIIQNEQRDFIRELDDYDHEWNNIDLSVYNIQMMGLRKVLPLVSSRGCPFACGFCYNQAVNKKTWRAHSVDFVVKKAEYLKKRYKIDGIMFHDDNFFTNLKRGVEIIEKIDLPWFGEIRANLITPDFVEWLKITKCRKVFIGAESGSNRILKDIQKKITTADLENAATRLNEANIGVHLSFILGFPGETEEDREKTFKFMDKLSQLGQSVECSLKVYTPYPATPFWQKAVAAGLMPPKTNEAWADFSRTTCKLPWIDIEKTEKIIKISALAFERSIPYSVMKPFIFIAQLRWRYKIYQLPFELLLLQTLSDFMNSNRLLMKIKLFFRKGR